jgi:hypothetical protein
MLELLEYALNLCFFHDQFQLSDLFQWLHKHIEYLTEETTAGSTKTVQIIVATATATANG